MIAENDGPEVAPSKLDYASAIRLVANTLETLGCGYINYFMARGVTVNYLSVLKFYIDIINSIVYAIADDVETRAEFFNLIQNVLKQHLSYGHDVVQIFMDSTAGDINSIDDYDIDEPMQMKCLESARLLCIFAEKLEIDKPASGDKIITDDDATPFLDVCNDELSQLEAALEPHLNVPGIYFALEEMTQIISLLTAAMTELSGEESVEFYEHVVFALGNAGEGHKNIEHTIN